MRKDSRLRSLYRRDNDHLLPAPACGGPWQLGYQHGGPPCALLAWAAERELEGSGLVPRRLSVDLFRRVPMEPLEVRTEIVRRGRRLAVLRCELIHQDVVVTQATALFVAPNADAAYDGEPEPIPHFPEPAQAEPMVPAAFRDRFPPGFHFEVEVVWVQSASGPRGAWLRAPLRLFEDADLSPFQHAAALSDFGNAITGRTRAGDAHGALGSKAAFINCDSHLFLDRPPVGEWLHLAVQRWSAPQGFGTTELALFDRHGRCGSVLQTSLAQVRSFGESSAEPPGATPD